VFTGWNMWNSQEVHLESERNPAVRLARRFLPLCDFYDEQRCSSA